jgi:hypothetical protein
MPWSSQRYVAFWDLGGWIELANDKGRIIWQNMTV